MKRDIISIDEEKCDGCGLCISGCHEGALQLIDGKARLVNELFCDGLGACIGDCPLGAITIENREAEDYDEIKTMRSLLAKSDATVIAHLLHLYEYNAREYYEVGIDFLVNTGRKDILEALSDKINNSKKGDKKMQFEQLEQKPHGHHHNHGHNHDSGACGCPGSAERTMDRPTHSPTNIGRAESALSHWPVQLHLVTPMAPFFNNTELVIMSTCGPIASPNVHTDYISGRSVVVACPKLDRVEPYAEKLAGIIANSNLKKLIVVRMEVPCCGGLTGIVKKAREMSGIDIIIEEHTLGLDGELIQMIRA